MIGATGHTSAQWSTAWIEPTATLVSVLVGAGITFAVGYIQRRWSQRDKSHDQLIARGEELIDRCQELSEWIEEARKVAFTGSGYGFVPVQSPIFRIAAIVELYYPNRVFVIQCG